MNWNCSIATATVSPPIGMDEKLFALYLLDVKIISALSETWLVHLIRMADEDPDMVDDHSVKWPIFAVIVV